jgi:hypothetical protein
MSEVIKTTAPLAVEDLKKYFVDKETKFIIDYENSTLKGDKLLTYLGNLDLPVDVENYTDELLEAYLHSKSIVNIPTLELNVIDLLLAYKFTFMKHAPDNNLFAEFFIKNSDILDIWSSKLDSLTLYNMYILEEDSMKKYVTDFPEDNTNDLTGVNFVSVLKHEEFYSWFQKVEDESLKYYSKYFNEYMFKGKSLFSFWGNDNNPMFLLTWGIASGEINSKEYHDAKYKDLTAG